MVNEIRMPNGLSPDYVVLENDVGVDAVYSAGVKVWPPIQPFYQRVNYYNITDQTDYTPKDADYMRWHIWGGGGGGHGGHGGNFTNGQGGAAGKVLSGTLNMKQWDLRTTRVVVGRGGNAGPKHNPGQSGSNTFVILRSASQNVYSPTQAVGGVRGNGYGGVRNGHGNSGLYLVTGEWVPGATERTPGAHGNEPGGGGPGGEGGIFNGGYPGANGATGRVIMEYYNQQWADIYL